MRKRTILGRVFRREQSTFAPPQSIKSSINDYICSKHVDFYLCKAHVLIPNIVISVTFYWFEAGQKLVRSRYRCIVWLTHKFSNYIRKTKKPYEPRHDKSNKMSVRPAKKVRSNLGKNPRWSKWLAHCEKKWISYSSVHSIEIAGHNYRQIEWNMKRSNTAYEPQHVKINQWPVRSAKT